MSQKPTHIVDAYAGAAYPERPRRVFWRDRWRDIADVEHQERHPHRRCFVVRLQPIAERDEPYSTFA